MAADKAPAKKEQSREENIKKLGELIKDVRMAMFTTAEEDGSLHSRPMATLGHEFDGRLWFFTREHSGKVASIKDDQHVNVAYSSPEKQHYVSVAGRGQIVRDKQKMKEFWNPMMKAWFPEGLKDPELCLIRVDAESAEYWDSPPSMIVKLVGFVEAIATGKAYDQLHGNHNEKVDLNKRH